jgi:hypothetical protein
MILNGKRVRIRKETVLACLKIISQILFGDTEGKNGRLG